jgi:hypothetical protein
MPQELIDLGKWPYATDKIELEKNRIRVEEAIAKGLKVGQLSGCGNPFLRNYPENFHLDEDFIRIMNS